MKKPKLNDLDSDSQETRLVRASMAQPQSIKITINIDADSLAQLRELADKTGVPYQRLLNRFLRDGLEKNNDMDSRLEKVEKELERLKKKIAA